MMERIGKVACWLHPPPILHVCPVFHASQLEATKVIFGTNLFNVTMDTASQDLMMCLAVVCEASYYESG